MKKNVIGAVLGAGLMAVPAFAQSSSGTWSDVPDRFQVDLGYFDIKANTVLRFNAGAGAQGEVDFEQDLGLNQQAHTFWVDGTWRLGRRHQLKVNFTRLSRERGDYTLQRDFTWGGQVYNVGLNASTSTSSDILAGYYRFAIVRSDRFEIGPAIGFGYLSIAAEIRATGSISGPGGPQSQTLDRSASTGSATGAIGGYVTGWLTKRFMVQGDFLYIKVSPGDTTASIVDWRAGANYYFFKGAGLGAQYKYDRYEYDRGILVSELGGTITYQGGQVFVTFRF